MKIDLSYRGPLASCNYDCIYCPFAKTFDDAETRRKDKTALARFYSWLCDRQGKDQFRVLFTPWGEALVRSWYRQTLVKLSHLAHVEKVVIQTNMSVNTAWLAEANLDKLALWITFHPSEISLEDFITKTLELDSLGVSYSVGIVGSKENMPYAEQLRKNLNKNTYLWVNAYKDEADYYQPSEQDFYQNIDPLFYVNNQNYPSLNQTCRSAVSAISVNGDGQIQPCHFVTSPLGNIYLQDLHHLLKDQFLCPKNSCDCYIGYRHLEHLKLESVYGERLLERIPINKI